MKKLYSVIVKGTRYKWSFETYCNPKYVKEWKDDGIDIDEIENIIPCWIVNIGLTCIWCILQDIFNFKWLNIS